MTTKTVIEQVKEINHYPEDVFLKLTNQQVARAVLAIQQAGISPDAYSAHLMRIAEQNTKKELLAILTEASKEYDGEITKLMMKEADYLVKQDSKIFGSEADQLIIDDVTDKAKEIKNRIYGGGT